MNQVQWLRSTLLALSIGVLNFFPTPASAQQPSLEDSIIEICHTQANIWESFNSPLFPGAEGKTRAKRTQAFVLAICANLEQQQNQFQESLQTIEKALTIVKEIDDREGQAALLATRGFVYNDLELYKQAEDSLQKSLELCRAVACEWRGKILNRLGLFYYTQEHYDEGLDRLQEALTTIDQLENSTNEADSDLRQLGQLLKLLLPNQQQCIAGMEYISSLFGGNVTDDKAAIFQNLGLIYLGKGDRQKALASFEQSLQVSKQITDNCSTQKVVALINIAGVYQQQGKSDQALNYLEQAQNANRFPSLKPPILGNLGTILFQTGQLEEAKQHFEQAIQALETQSEPRGDINQVALFEKEADYYIMLQKILVAQGQNLAALEVAERGRAHVLAGLLSKRLSGQQKVEFPNLEKIKKVASEQNATIVEYSIIPSLEDITNLNREDYRNSELFIWVIQPDGKVNFRSVDLPQETSFQELIQLSRTSIGVRGRGNSTSTPSKRNSTTHLQQLHQLLIEPIADLLPTDEEERIVFILHQELFAVPFPALMDAEEKYLIEKHTILTAPSIQSLSFTRQRKQQLKNSSPPKGREVLIVGNPQMPKQGVGPNLKPLAPLPGAEKEAKAISPIFETKPIIGSDATETAIVERMPNAKVIHLATHGLLDDFSGIGSPGAIALTPSGQDDGFLTTTEIMERFGQPGSTPLKAELAVLSACDTGSGDIKGEGVIGLSRSLIAAGVPTIVVSLWKVPDDDTNLLMTEFYTNLYQKKLDKAQAMRQAMLTMLNDDEKGNFNPIAWAAFTVIGEAE
ncbi:MAG: tetratricopeptide repeat protein [Symploca sp. SIO2D2]|nr:tetratricopeptide repeat protein [Symploca sp. SIO2D2]